MSDSIVSFRRRREKFLRDEAYTKAKAQYGSKCQFCGTTKRRLALAHRRYEADSVMPHENGIYRAEEAVQDPSRFYLLCVACHVAFDTVRKVAEIDILTLKRVWTY